MRPPSLGMLVAEGEGGTDDFGEGEAPGPLGEAGRGGRQMAHTAAAFRSFVVGRGRPVGGGELGELVPQGQGRAAASARVRASSPGESQPATGSAAARIRWEEGVTG